MKSTRFIRRMGICLVVLIVLAAFGYPQTPPQVTTLPQVDFGQVLVGSSKTVTYPFQNTLGERLTINTIGFGAPFYQEDPPFYLSGVVFPSTLDPGQIYRFQIRFAPLVEGTFRPRRGPLTICVYTERTEKHIHYEIPLVGEGVRAAPPQELTLRPTQDTFVDAALPHESKGQDPYLWVGTGAWGDFPKRTLIQFDLSRVPTGAQILSARLRLYKVETSFYDEDSVRIYTLHRILEEWDATTAVWGTLHGTVEPELEYDQEVLAQAEIRHAFKTGGPEWVEWDVTSDIRSGMPHYGWMIKDRDELVTNEVYNTAFCSSEEDFWQDGEPVDCVPQLIIVYLEPARPELPALLDHTMCKDVQTDYPYDPIEPTYTFLSTDRRAVSWLKFGPIYRSHRVEWKWYSPDGNLYWSYTGSIPDPKAAGEDHWEWYKIWCWIDIQGATAASLPGNWKVDVYLDGQKVLTERFSIQ